MKNKKAVAIRFLILLVLGVFVFLILVTMVPRLLGKGAGETEDLLTQTRDFDRDGIADFFDKCDCKDGTEENDGCPPNEPLSGEDAEKREKECRERIEGTK